MRHYFIWAVMLVFILVALPLRAADWTLKMAADAKGTPLTSLSTAKPFWVILTNCTDHNLALVDYQRFSAQNEAIYFLFKKEAKEFFVSDGGSGTWYSLKPRVIEPKQSFPIEIDMTKGYWNNTKALDGLMTVKVIYKQNIAHLPKTLFGKPQSQVWVGEVESEPIQVTISR